MSRLAKVGFGLFAVPTTVGIAAWGTERVSSQNGADSLPRTYDADAIRTYWNNRPFTALLRVGEIMATVIPLGSHSTATTLLQTRVLPQLGIASDKEWKSDIGKRIRVSLSDLGPTFIKFGQMLSIRPDILPPEILYELQKLCDQVPSFPTSIAIDVIERELGCSVDEVFTDLNDQVEPIAAASLGQVYKATRKKDGQTVAVKVQRPDMHHAVSLDLFLLRRYMHFVEWVKTFTTVQKPYDVKLLDTFGKATFGELDYVNEGQNQEEFARGFAGNERIYVPDVFWDSTSRMVLSTEWIEGVQLAKSSPEVINRLTKVGIECFLSQLLDLGFFHSDPHPGNLLVDEEGRLVLIDFGLCARVDSPAMRHMTDCLIHLMEGNVASLLDDAVNLGFLHESVDKQAIYPVLQSVFTRAAIASEDASQQSGGYATKARRKQLKAVSDELNQIFFDFPFQVPDYFALVTRALIVLEGIAVTGDASFDLFRATYPYATKKAMGLPLQDLVELNQSYTASRRTYGLNWILIPICAFKSWIESMLSVQKLLWN